MQILLLQTHYYKSLVSNIFRLIQVVLNIWLYYSNIGRGRSRTPSKSYINLIVTIVNGWRSILIFTRTSILNISGVVDPFLISDLVAI